jgi:hypothetical protein
MMASLSTTGSRFLRFVQLRVNKLSSKGMLPYYRLASPNLVLSRLVLLRFVSISTYHALIILYPGLRC